MNRTIYDGKSLYDYYIDGAGSLPVLVIRDLSDEPGVERRRESYRTVTNDKSRVIAEIEHQTGQNYDNFAVIYRDTQGIYDGIDMIGTTRKVFNLQSGQHITDEALAITVARKIHETRIALLNVIHSNLPMGRIVQFSSVEICIGGDCYSYTIPGYPSKECIIGTKSYKNILKEHPQADKCSIEIVSHLIHGKVSHASEDLMKAMTAYGLNMIPCLSTVSMGESARHIVKLNN